MTSRSHNRSLTRASSPKTNGVRSRAAGVKRNVRPFRRFGRDVPTPGERVSLRALQLEINRWARRKGWWKVLTRDQAQALLCLAKLALVHSEVSEAVEAIRDRQWKTELDANGKPVGLGSELADTVIRVLDLAQHLGIDVGSEIARKMAFNRRRPRRHGGKLA